MHLRWRRLIKARTVATSGIAALLWTLLEVHRALTNLDAAARHISPPLSSRASKPKIFLASTHWTTEHVLRSNWTTSVLNLASELGPDNVFVSVVESASIDRTKDALLELKEQLQAAGIPNRFILDESTHADAMVPPKNAVVDDTPGWIMTPRGLALRRIPYLSKWRNRSLEPLYSLASKGHSFDKVAFLNDVVFTIQDFTTLLDTRDGQYAAACSLDFSYPPSFYDTFALRDADGHEAVSMTWPYFRSATSREAMKRTEPVLVQSCWNGMVIMDAAPFVSSSSLKFRGLPDTLAQRHLEASECCLIHADNPLSSRAGVWLNPKVRVAYSSAAYDIVNPVGRPWLSGSQIAAGLWRARFLRWTTGVDNPKIAAGLRRARFLRSTTVDRMNGAEIRRRDGQYEAVGKSHSGEHVPEPSSRLEAGAMCLVNEMQILAENGWKHV